MGFHSIFTLIEKRIAKTILTKANMKVVAEALIKQLVDELSVTCRTEDVREVWIDVSDVYYPDSDKNDVNMDFYTDYVTQRGGTEGGLMDRFYGFVSPNTIGRYSRKDKKFYEISNSMLSSCELM